MASRDDPARPAARAKASALVSACCHLLVLTAAVLHVVEVFESPWTAFAFLYLAAAAVGVDAVVSGVRMVRGEGPSIRNLTPGGWAMFAALFFVLAVPAYYLGARRRARRGYDVPVEPLGLGTWAAIGSQLAGAAALLVWLWC